MATHCQRLNQYALRQYRAQDTYHSFSWFLYTNSTVILFAESGKRFHHFGCVVVSTFKTGTWFEIIVFTESGDSPTKERRIISLSNFLTVKALRLFVSSKRLSLTR